MIEIYPTSDSNRKSISESIHDQVFGLTCKEYANHNYRRQHKIIILILNALTTYFNNTNNNNNNNNNHNDRYNDICRGFIAPSQEQGLLLEIKTQINSNNWIKFTTLCGHISNNNDDDTTIESSNSNNIKLSLSSSSLSLMLLCQLLLDFIDTRSDYI